MRIPEGIINDIRSKSDIVDVISTYLTLSKKGKNYVGICPFHEDHDPSMTVAPDKQIYKCFSCGAGGNIFTFVQNYEQISFVEAVIKMGNLANVDMNDYHVTNAPQISESKQGIYDALDETQKFTEYQLYSKEGKVGLDLMKEREYSQELLKNFGVGLVFKDNQIYNFLKAKSFEDKTLLEADLIRLQEDEIKDVFYDRIMFPIHDAYGKVIAFSARALDKNSKVKYINSAETDVYIKSNVLYNFHRAKDEARKKSMIIVSEGVTDSIAFTKAGFINVVSLLGVACSPSQIKLLKQASNNVVLAFDADRAGIDATYQTGQKLRAAHCNVSVWYNDSGLDPDDLLRTKGKIAIEEGIENRSNWFDFLIHYSLSIYGLESFEHKKKVVEFVLNDLKKESNLEKSYYLEKLAKLTGFDQSVLSAELNLKSQKKIQPIRNESATTKISFMDSSLSELNILNMIIESREAAYIYRDGLGFLPSPNANKLALIILNHYRTHEKLNVADLISQDIGDETRSFLINLQSSTNLMPYNETVLKEIISLIEKQLTQFKLRDLRAQNMVLLSFEKSQKALSEAIETLRIDKKEGV